MKARIAAGLVVLAGLAAGCSAHPGVAATVDGQPITMTELDEATTLSPMYQTPPTPDVVLNRLIDSRVFIDVAAENGMGVSSEEAAQFLDSLEAEDLREDGQYPDPVLDLIRLNLIHEQLQTDPNAEQFLDKVSERLEDTDVELSPRFSQWQFSADSIRVPDWVERGQ